MTTPDNDSSMPAGEIIEALSGPCNDALCVRCGARWGDHGAGSYDARCPDHSGQRWERTHFAPAVDPDYLRLHDEVDALRAELAEANREIVRLGVVRDGLIGASDRLEAELERITTERDAIANRLPECREAYLRERDEADRMRPVVEACCFWVDECWDVKDGNSFKAMHAAKSVVNAYRATNEQETTDA